MNNKGFAISIIMYSMVFLLIAILYMILGIMRTRYTVNAKLRDSIIDKLNAINEEQCESPTIISISSAGVVTWTPSSNCPSAQHQICIDSCEDSLTSEWTDANSGINYKEKIVVEAGPRTVYVKALAPDSNFIDSEPGTGETVVYTVTLTAGTGIKKVSGGGNFISGATTTISATVKSGYEWYRWTMGSVTYTANPKTITVNEDKSFTASAKELHTYGILCTCIGEKYCQMSEMQPDSTSNVCSDADGWCNRYCKGRNVTAGCNPANSGFSRGCRTIN